MFDPLLKVDALGRLMRQTPRRLTIRVANPNDLNMLGGDNPLDIEGNLQSFQDMLDSNAVSVTWSFTPGTRDAELDRQPLRRLIRWGRRNRHNVKALRVETLEEDNPIDMLGDQISRTVEVVIDNNQPAASYAARMEELRQFYEDERATIVRLYGP